ncbi:RBP1 protein, partial [Phainopepla nitens]|nr:RBP1 protein [Phainopepla nitens]
CSLLPTSSPSEHCKVEHSSSLAHTPSSEEISPTEFLQNSGLNSTTELSPPHDHSFKPPDTVSDDGKECEKKKRKIRETKR